MELEFFRGLPAHPLFVHIPVVLIPLAGVIAIVFAIRPAWLDRFGWGLVALTGVGMIGAILAASTGEAFEEVLEERGEEISQALKNHAEGGELARTLSIVFFVIVLAVVLVRRAARKSAPSQNGIVKFGASKAGAIVMSVLIAASAAGATLTVADAGHEGAEVVWEEDGQNAGTDEGVDQGEEEEEGNG